MKRFIAKISLLFIPLIIWYGIFLAFEPNNYFNISKEERRSVSSALPVKKMRKINWNNYECLLLGDSRAAGIDEDVIEDITGKKYYNLAFGGCSLQEEIDLFWWAVKQQSFDKVVFMASFWTISTAYNGDRIKYVEKVAADPIQYLLAGQYHIETVKTILHILKNKDENKNYTPEERKENKKYYADAIIYPLAENFEINYNAIKKIKDISDFCAENGIEFNIFIPPIDESIWEYVIKPLNLTLELDKYKSELSMFCKVYDMEYENVRGFLESDFADGFHLNGSTNINHEAVSDNSVLISFLRELFMVENKISRVWMNGNLVQSQNNNY